MLNESQKASACSSLPGGVCNTAWMSGGKYNVNTVECNEVCNTVLVIELIFSGFSLSLRGLEPATFLPNVFIFVIKMWSIKVIVVPVCPAVVPDFQPPS